MSPFELPRKLAMALIRLYQVAISPWLPPGCRFVPSCSQYAMEAFARHGFWRGGWLTFTRLLRCRPGCRHGYDPVPENRYVPLVPRQTTLGVTPKGGRAATGGVSKARTAFFALRSSRQTDR